MSDEPIVLHRIFPIIRAGAETGRRIWIVQGDNIVLLPNGHRGLYSDLSSQCFAILQGMVPNVLRVLPSSGVTFLVYESVNSALERSH